MSSMPTTPERDAKRIQVNTVLKEIGAAEVPQIEVFNKIDLLEGAEPRVDCDEAGNVIRVHLSAVSGSGISFLLETLAGRLQGHRVRRKLRLPPRAGRLRARFYEMGVVVNEALDENGDWLLEIDIRPHHLAMLRNQQEFAD